MPITGRQPESCFKPFRDHVAQLFATTITPTEQVRYDGRELNRVLAFRQGDQPTTVPLDTRLGRVFFYFGQLLTVEKEHKDYRLVTKKYWYRLQSEAGYNEKAFLRWEYDSNLSPGEKSFCRHHVQLSQNLPINEAEQINLDKAHIPTGWVTVEEIIRFLIMDLRIQPLCGDDWPTQLAQSEKKFYEEFTSKRYSR